jgi:hypothetical protein
MNDGAAKSRKFRKSPAFSGEKQGFPAAISTFCRSVMNVCPTALAAHITRRQPRMNVCPSAPLGAHHEKTDKNE